MSEPDPPPEEGGPPLPESDPEVRPEGEVYASLDAAGASGKFRFPARQAVLWAPIMSAVAATLIGHFVGVWATVVILAMTGLGLGIYLTRSASGK